MTSSKPAYEDPLFHTEPAHPGVIKLHEDLVAIYRLIREQHQAAIDRAFDDVSRQIGFVIMTTLPVKMGVDGATVTTSLVGENLPGTLFDRTFSEILQSFDVSKGQVADGTYELYLIWYEALKLKLHTDWMEPAHIPGRGQIDVAQRLRPGVGEVVGQRPGFGPGVREPAHWFDGSIVLQLNEVLVISAIDEVYPELRLVDRIKDARRIRVPATFGPGVREPAHFRQFLDRFDEATLDEVVQVIQAIQKLR